MKEALGMQQTFAMYAVQAVHNNIMQDEMFALQNPSKLYPGSSGRSYVVGCGEATPERCHHRAASCPDAPSQCGLVQLIAPTQTPDSLNGALVGGPDSQTTLDDRNNFAMTEVKDDYNAGSKTALAGLNNLPIDVHDYVDSPRCGKSTCLYK